MATIPQVIDYGSRPSLRSGRVDVPGRGENALADAIVVAADQFSAVLKERKGKQDALAYASAKSDLISEDIELRRQFVDDQEHETFAERYRAGMAEARDRITPMVSNPHDRAIFDADANLTVERGVSAVSEMSRIKRISYANAKLDSDLEKLGNDIADTEDAMTRRDMLLHAGEYIQAGVDAGNVHPDVGGKKRRAFVQEVAIADLYSMEADEAVEALQRSIDMNIHPDDLGRRTMAVANPKGLIEEGNIDINSRPQVKLSDGKMATVRSKSFEIEGEEVLIPTVSPDGKLWSDQQALTNYHKTGEHLGKFATVADATTYAKALSKQQGEFYSKPRSSGSLADFLHEDEKHKLLRVFETQGKQESILAAAFEASNASWMLHPDYKKGGDREAYLRQALKDNPEALKEALLQERQRRASEVTIEGDRLKDIYDDERAKILEAAEAGSPIGFNQLNQGALAELDPTTLASLRREAENFYYRDGWNDVDTWDARETWRMLSAEEKVAINLEAGTMPKVSDDDPDISWRSEITAEKALAWQEEQRMIVAAGGKEPVTDRGLTPSQLLRETLIQSTFFVSEPTKTDTSELNDRWSRLETAWGEVVAQASEAKGGKLKGTELQQLMDRFMEQEVFIRELGRDPERLALSLSDKERLEAYIPLQDERMDVLVRPVGSITFDTPTGPQTVDLPPSGRALPMREWLNNMHKFLNAGEEGDKKTIEEAAYYYVMFGKAQALSRLAGAPGL